MSLIRSVLGPRTLGLPHAVERAVEPIIPKFPRSVSVSISLEWPWSWSGLLRAVPKQRSSHQKKRQRQLAGNNQQKPLHNLNRCPACGHVKRAHTLCMNCVQGIRRTWRARDRAHQESQRDPTKFYDPSKLSKEDAEFNYPSRVNRPSEYDEKLADRESYVLDRPETLVAKQKKTSKEKLPLLVRKPYK